MTTNPIPFQIGEEVVSGDVVGTVAVICHDGAYMLTLDNGDRVRVDAETVSAR